MPFYQQRPSSGAPPFLVAHRGISGKAPENTLASFRRALQTPGIDGVELDVRLTRDEQVIVHHDRTLQRTTTGNGAARDYTLAEIKNFDAGSWFHHDFASERVPTLAEVFELLGDERWINIELKSDYFHRESPGLLERRVIETVHACGRQKTAFYSSFDHAMVRRIREIDPHANTGVLYNLYRDFYMRPSTLVRRAHASVFVCARHELHRPMVEDLHDHGYAVYVYTLNTHHAAEKMIGYGVDAILSDDADDIAPLLAEKFPAAQR